MGKVLSTTSQQCCFSCVLCGYACLSGGPGKLTNKFAFFPPNPATYSVDATTSAPVYHNPHVAAEARQVAKMPIDTSVQMLRTRGGNEVALFWFAPRRRKRQLTLLWSHGNAMDCGELHGFLATLACNLGINVAAYDYSGYGASTGRPCERALNQDILCVYEHLRASKGVDAPKELVVYGQSIGSGPSVKLCSRRPVRALVLHAPIASGVRVLAPNWSNACSPVRCFAPCDMFNNLRLAPRLAVPMLLMHGTDDEVVDGRNTAALHAAVARAGRARVEGPLWVQGAGHNDLVEVDPMQYFQALGNFLGTLEEAA